MSRYAKFFNVPLDQYLDEIWKAVNENMSAGTKVPLGGKTLTKQQLLDLIDSMRKPYADVKGARDTLERFIETRDENEGAVLTFVKAYNSAIQSSFGSSQDVADGYKLLVRQPARELTVEEKAAKKAKAAATRQKRGTMGSRQKEQVKATGEFTVTVTGPDAAQPTSPAPTAQPLPVISSAPAPVISAAPTSTTVASPPAPAASSSGDSASAPSGSNGSVAPMLMNGSGH